MLETHRIPFLTLRLPFFARIVVKENELNFLQKELEKQLDEKKSLNKIKNEQSKALIEINDDDQLRKVRAIFPDRTALASQWIAVPPFAHTNQ